MKFDYTIFMMNECDAETSNRISDTQYRLMKEKSGAPYGMITNKIMEMIAHEKNKIMEMIAHEKHETDSERA